MISRVLLAACLAGAACAPDGEPGAGASADSIPANDRAPAHHFIVDSARYALRPDGEGLTASIGFVFRNPLEDTLYVVNCNGHVVMDLQKRTPDGWETVWHAMTNGCLSPAIEIAPSDSLVGRMDVWGALPGHPNFPTFETDSLDGEFRLIWHQPRLHFTAAAPDFGDTLSHADRSTTPFELRRTPDR